MTIEKVTHTEGQSVISLYELTRYGEADIHRDVTVSHDPAEIATLPAITEDQVKHLPRTTEEEQEAELPYVKLPTGDTLVFIRDYDMDWGSNTYRQGAYAIRGPYRLVPDAAGQANPEISESGKKVLEVIASSRAHATYKYSGNVYGWLGDPVIPDFGDLGDLSTPCSLVINDYYTPDTSADGDYNETGKDIIYFDKRMAQEALTRVRPGEKIIVKGKGRLVHFKEKGGWSYNHNVDSDKEDIDTEAEVSMNIMISGNFVRFAFDAKATDTAITYTNHQDILLSSMSCPVEKPAQKAE